MKLSIIIPYYNSDSYIGEVLDDLLHQDMLTDEYEIIVVDDGSTDSIETLRSYCAHHQNIRYFWQGNGGVSLARNVGLKAARGEYVFFCDSDDRVRRCVLGYLYEIAVKYDLEVLFFNHLNLKETKNIPPTCTGEDLDTPIINGDTYFACHPKMPLASWFYLTKRSFLMDNDLSFQEDAYMVEDQIFTISLLLKAKRVSHIDTEAYFYIQRPSSMVHKAGKILQAKRTADCRLQFIRYMKKILNEHNFLCRKSIKAKINFITFVTLHNAFRYLSISQNKNIIRELKKIDTYPIGEWGKPFFLYHLILWIMNRPTLWMICCVMFHILPEKLRKKL